MVAEAYWKPKARVCLVIRKLVNRCGGAERLFCEMANMLAAFGYEVTCLYCDHVDGLPFYPLSSRVSRINLWAKVPRFGLPYVTLDALGLFGGKAPWLAPLGWLSDNAYFIRRLAAALASMRPDVAISFLPPANTPTLIAGTLAKVPVIPTNHNVPEQDYTSPTRWDQNPVDRFLRLRMLDHAERIHVLFETFAGWFPGHLRSKIVTIPNYISEDFDNVDIEGLRSRVIVAVGRLAPVKNYQTLVEAWSLIARKHPGWTVRIYGAGPDQQVLTQKIHELGLESSLLLMGHVHDMRQAYLDSEILCHPALFEGFGLAAAEALACGTPVVAFSDCAGVNEFVKDNVNGLMVDRSSGSVGLAAALSRLILDEPLRLRLRHGAAKSISQFHREVFLSRWSALIDEVTNVTRATA